MCDALNASCHSEIQRVYPLYEPEHTKNQNNSPITAAQYFGLPIDQLAYEFIMLKDPLLVNVSVMEQFAVWLATEAQSEPGDLSKSKCERYLSSIKMAVIRRCFSGEPRLVSRLVSATSCVTVSPLKNEDRVREVRRSMIQNFIDHTVPQLLEAE